MVQAMKKLFLGVAVCAPVLAIGGSLLLFAPQGSLTAYACEVPSCEKPASHTHDVCALEGCALPDYHRHGGVIYFAHFALDGHYYHIAAPTVSAAPPPPPTSPSLSPSLSLSSSPSPSLSPSPEGIPSAVSPAYVCDIDACPIAQEHGHALCALPGCAVTNGHGHGGTYYYGHRGGDGHAYHTCGVSGCDIAASHAHGHARDGGHHGRGHH
jgi:hypothetical protein